MRDFVSTQVKQSQVSIEGLRDDIKFQASMTQSQLGAMKEASVRQSSNSLPVRNANQFQNQGRSKEDIQTQTLKATMLDDVKEALAAEKLDCRPIKGHDFPLGQNHMVGSRSQQQNRVGLGGAQIVEVMNMDRFEGYDPHPQKAKINDDQMIL